MKKELFEKVLNAYKYAKFIKENQEQDIWREEEHYYSSSNSNLKNEKKDFYDIVKQFEGKSYGELLEGRGCREVDMTIIVKEIFKNIKIELNTETKECLNTFMFREKEDEIFIHKKLSQILYFYLLFKFKDISNLFKIEPTENFEFTYEGILNNEVLNRFYIGIKKKYVTTSNYENFDQLMDFFESSNLIAPVNYLYYTDKQTLELSIVKLSEHLGYVEDRIDQNGSLQKKVYNFERFELV